LKYMSGRSLAKTCLDCNSASTILPFVASPPRRGNANAKIFRDDKIQRQWHRFCRGLHARLEF
jgi:hypothetical protein